jgi:hypothetical protein
MLQVKYRVSETGNVFKYPSPRLSINPVSGIKLADWCRIEVGEYGTLWGIWLEDGAAVWWFMHEEDAMRFSLTWC